MKYLLFFTLLLCQHRAVAQRCFKAYDAPTGGNEISVFCVGQQVYFRDCAGIDADKEYYDYDSSNGLDFNTSEAQAKSYTFTSPGTYTVTQFGNLNGVNGYHPQQFVVRSIAAPTFTAAACEGRKATLSISDQTYDSYLIRFGDGSAPVTAVPGQALSYTYATDGTYTITLTGTYNAGSCTTTPASQTVTTLPTLPVPQLAELAVLGKGASDGAIRFVFDQLHPSFRYFLEEMSSGNRVSHSEPVSGIQQPGTLTLTKQNTNASQSRCFRIRATDACGMEKVSATVCSVVLSATPTGNENIQLAWQQAGGSSQVQYVLELLNSQNTAISSIPVNGSSYTHNPAAIEQALLRYRIRATAADGSFVALSNIEEVPQPLRLYVPSAFTPNGDGLNDVFEVKGKHFQDFSIRIFNNLGQVVYEASDAAAAWDGTHKGKQLPPGAYVYEIRVTAADGSNKTRKGTVTLIK